MIRIVRYISNIVTGVIVFLFAFLMSGALVEESRLIPSRWYYFLLAAVWITGLFWQIKPRMRAWGIIITMLPTAYILIAFYLAWMFQNTLV
ncbi:hypothetical protein [Alkalicoccus luteus]|uniref:Cyd operon protein YbgE n=1 Tax=Alkalicoccus luteus TaxID=1237094 RepID=A0A969PRR0_9BACI|nr:hypothetical protein [Alkalicoccus luteus]NJP37829.1 hypothetical protein [Alkalicoccus luteus]